MEPKRTLAGGGAIATALWLWGAVAWSAGAFDAAVTAYQAGDYVGARTLWEQALAAGDWDAARSLGILYRKGLGVAADPAKAADYYQQAVTHGVVGAELNLAEMLLAGQGVPQDVGRAKALLKVAADKGNPIAKDRLEDIEEEESRGGRASSVYEALPDDPRQARVYLGSYASADAAAAGWLSYNLPGLLADVEFIPAAAGAVGQQQVKLYAIGPMEVVRQLCRQVKSQGQACRMDQ